MEGMTAEQMMRRENIIGDDGREQAAADILASAEITPLVPTLRSGVKTPKWNIRDHVDVYLSPSRRIRRAVAAWVMDWAEWVADFAAARIWK